MEPKNGCAIVRHTVITVGVGSIMLEIIITYYQCYSFMLKLTAVNVHDIITSMHQLAGLLSSARGYLSWPPLFKTILLTVLCSLTLIYCWYITL